MNIFSESLKFHKKLRGKLKFSSKVPIKNRKMLSLVYTPGVGAVSSAIAKNKQTTDLYTMKGQTVAVVTDGSSVLGLGNIGPEAALPVMEGKAALFSDFAHIDAFPICLKTQNTEEIISTIKYISPSIGAVNLEDIAAPRCFEIERRLRAELDIPVMHDDQHGTATVVLAGLMNALKLRKLLPSQVKMVINGSGAAGTAITKICLEFGVSDIVVCDTKGAIYAGRPDLNEEKIEISKITNKKKIKAELSEALVGAHVFIGVSRGNLLTEKMVRGMAEKPIIFALANPYPEIMPDVAKKAGAFIVATGRSDFPNQVNNVLAFPGIFRGALDNKIKQFEDRMFVKAAYALARATKNLSVDQILPDPFDTNVVKVVARAIK